MRACWHDRDTIPVLAAQPHDDDFGGVDRNMTIFTRVLIALVVSAYSASAFVPSPAAFSKTHHHRTSDGASSATPTSTRPATRQQHAGPLSMGWGDALGKAFANEDMAPMKNPGLKSEPNTCMVSVSQTVFFVCLKFEATWNGDGC